MLAKVVSSAIVGLDALPVEVEVDIASQGLPAFTIVGLPDKAVEEAKERVRSAIKNTGADFPAKRITVNLAPADLPKEGPSYDLPIALGILLASGQIPEIKEKTVVVGELALDGSVRAVNGALIHTLMARKENIPQIFLPKSNSKEASIVSDVVIYPIEDLKSLLNHLAGIEPLDTTPTVAFETLFDEEQFESDMRDIRGQHQAKRALEIAAAGGHNMLLKGPPGAGKTLLARTLPSILPPLTFDEALEVTKIYSIAGLLSGKKVFITRPFRAPHHSTSIVGIIGGSSTPRPGELTLSHRGVLFLDEFPEFPRNILESLRQPIEDGMVSISRAKGKVTFPTKMMLIAAQNPCPCGFFGDLKNQCSCLPTQILKYQKKVSGPLLDRIDIHITVPAVKTDALTADENAESSKEVRKRVKKARAKQQARFAKRGITTNAEMTSKQVKTFCKLDDASEELLRKAAGTLNLSARSYFRVIKLARTIADLEDEKNILVKHLAEALQYRPHQERSVR